MGVCAARKLSRHPIRLTDLSRIGTASRVVDRKSTIHAALLVTTTKMAAGKAWTAGTSRPMVGALDRIHVTCIRSSIELSPDPVVIRWMGSYGGFSAKPQLGCGNV